MPVAVLDPRRGYLKLLKENTRGTPIATTVSMTVDNRSLQGKWARIKPTYMNNSVHGQREVAAGRRNAAGDFGGQVTMTEIGHAIMAIMGQDTPTGAGPYTHTFLPVTATPTYTIEKNAGGLTGASQSEQFANAVCSKLTLGGQIERDDAVLMYSTSWLAKAPTLITPTAWTQPTSKVVPAALAAYEYPIATGVNDLVCDFSVTIERAADLVKGANNSLDISDAVATQIRVSGFVDMYFVDYSVYSDFTANTERSISIKWLLSASESIQIKMSKLYWDDENLEEGQTFLKRRFPFSTIYDPGAALGAVNIILINNQAAAY